MIPGLVIVHEHFFGPYGSIGAWYGESFTCLYLAGGVPSIRTAGGVSGYADLAIKLQIDRGLKPGPWIDASAPFLQGPGGPPNSDRWIHGERGQHIPIVRRFAGWLVGTTPIL